MTLNDDDSGDPFPEVSGYRIVRRIGAGGMGQVYLAVQESLDRTVVIKVLNSVSDNSGDTSADRFEREALLMAKGSHPNVVGVIDRGTIGGRLFIVMEHVEGGDLRSRLTGDSPMPIGEARPILLAIGRALTALHDRDIIHRDLKPENVLIDRAGKVRITDFGIAAPLDEIGQLTNENVSPGTLDYMAPEQRYRLGVDARTDQYALALIAHEMLTGRRPRGILGPPSDHNPHVTKIVDDVILRGLQEDPDERFPAVAAFSEALDQSLAACPTTRGAPAAQGRGRLTRRIVVVGVLVLLGAIALIGSLCRFSPEGPINSPVGIPDTSERPEHARVETEDSSKKPADSSVGTNDAADKPEVVEQAGALIYRIQEGVVQILLIRSRQDAHWTIPKGTKDRGVTLSKTAVDETFEEAGVRGTLRSTSVGSYYYSKKDKLYHVTVFSLLAQEELSTWPEDFRRREWFSMETAADLDAPDGLRDLIRNLKPNDL